ncbi:M23 family metallopeptidase [Bacillus sp. DTU_2020_1000418_1_SI_GHA_SEK_038]|uniref:M23 family metallopeptidase n=1 Tax=Bacillus sp. DTU_2020_1000418_1_SI_GHA_SEK_038 TaxID=3077585 RepID=UPI0028F04106|nr:M23 family metallopeptidase [Bacillus sp. DTU_2020_1000418_1_SI_GHA_SEK_038]WNS74220.1 M23 family metallopeptidase [Bacillus sp. DTU_2020_1000418_1_SI_GHA_SEK_038]
MIIRITSKFREMESFRSKPHTGIDLSFPEGSELKSIGDSVVEKIVDYGSENIGKGVILRLADGKQAIYGHLSDIKVKAGQSIAEGQIIGLSGNTGNSTGPHLHLALKENGSFIDPTPLAHKLMAWEQSIGGYFFDKFIQSRIEHFVSDFIISLPVLVGVSFAVWGLLNMVSGRLASVGVVGVFILGGLVIL